MKVNPWAVLPVIVIGAALIPNAILVMAARDARPEPVSAQAWQDTLRFDADRQAAEAFASAGGRFAAQLADRQATFTASFGGQPTQAVHVRLYCPAAAAADRTVPWPDPTRPLVVDLPRGGRWVARLDAEAGRGLATVTFHAP